MAQRVITLLVSDLSGEDLGEEGQSVKFGFLGVDYEIDLSQKEADEFAKVMERYIGAGRRVGGRRQTGGASAARRSSSDLQKVREWARANGHEVSERGRIKKEIMEAYEAAN